MSMSKECKNQKTNFFYENFKNVKKLQKSLLLWENEITLQGLQGKTLKRISELQNFFDFLHMGIALAMLFTIFDSVFLFKDKIK